VKNWQFHLNKQCLCSSSVTGSAPDSLSLFPQQGALQDLRSPPCSFATSLLYHKQCSQLITVRLRSRANIDQHCHQQRNRLYVLRYVAAATAEASFEFLLRSRSLAGAKELAGNESPAQASPRTQPLLGAAVAPAPHPKYSLMISPVKKARNHRHHDRSLRRVSIDSPW